MKKTYEYFVSYNFNDNGVLSSGCCNLLRDEKIKSFEDVIEISEVIKEEFGYDKVVILNWILF